MLGFRQKKIPLLGHDVVSRGIDIDSIEIVINYDVPPNEEITFTELEELQELQGRVRPLHLLFQTICNGLQIEN